MKNRHNDAYYLLDEDIADMRYESDEALAKKILGGFTFVAVFGLYILTALCSFLGT